MKKRILLSTILTTLSTGAVSAATLYNKDGLTLSLKGDMQIQLFQAPGENEKFDVDYDDLELKFSTQYALDNISAFGELDIDWKNQGDGSDDDVVNKAYLGIGFNDLTISLGRQEWGSDNFSTEQAIEMDGGTAFPETDGNDTFKVTYNHKQFESAIAIDIEDSTGDEAATDLWLKAKLKQIDIGVAYQAYELNGTSVDTFGIMAKFKTGATKIGLDFSSNDDLDAINLSARYSLAKDLKIAAGVTRLSPKDAENTLHSYTNISKYFHKNVSIFAELGANDIDDSDLGVLTGMRIKF